ncbi:MAG: hypothetical protein ACK5MD_03365 [Flavobacteriales bacterium]
MKFKKITFILGTLLFMISCSNDDDNGVTPCPEVINQGGMTIEGSDSNTYPYNNLKYSYMDREGKDNNGNFVYQFIYSNYDIENTSQVQDGYFLKFRITTPEDIPDGLFSLNNSVKTISDVETFYDYTPGGTIGRIDVSEMTVTFSNFDSCLNHEIAISFSDTDFSPGTTGNGSFSGKSNLYTIQ